jgi:hypothetical protein
MKKQEKRRLDKRAWRDIFLSASILVGGLVMIVGCFVPIPAENLIADIFYGFLGAGVALAGFTIPENISKWKNRNDNNNAI